MDIPIDKVVVDDRERKAFDEHTDEWKLFVASVKQFGVIQPIVLAVHVMNEADPENSYVAKLCAGERRLRALRACGVSTLVYGQHYIRLSDANADPLRQKAVEIEENIKRKAFSWSEEVLAKKKLFDLMQKIHGVARNNLTKAEQYDKAVGHTNTFGLRQLSAMLGESLGKVSKDLNVARAITALPELAKADTKESAIRKLNTAGIVAGMTKLADLAEAKRKLSPTALATPRLWEVHCGDFGKIASQVTPDNTADLILCDLPYSSGIQNMSRHVSGIAFDDDVLPDSFFETLAQESFRVLRPDRFALYFFGFVDYDRLCTALKAVGFSVRPVPLVWTKNTKATENPNTHYGNSYEPILVVAKGRPLLIRPGQSNVLQFPVVPLSERLHIAQKPVALLQKLIQDTTTAGSTIVDFCAGAGSTGEAGILCKSRVILFDKEERWTKLATTRLEAADAKTAKPSGAYPVAKSEVQSSTQSQTDQG